MCVCIGVYVCERVCVDENFLAPQVKAESDRPSGEQSFVFTCSI